MTVYQERFPAYQSPLPAARTIARIPTLIVCGSFGQASTNSANSGFLSEDPIGFAGGDANLYRYAGNDPVNYRDPSGLFGEGYFSDDFGFGNDIAFSDFGYLDFDFGDLGIGSGDFFTDFTSTPFGFSEYAFDDFGFSDFGFGTFGSGEFFAGPRFGGDVGLGQFGLASGTLSQAQEALTMAGRLNDVQTRISSLESSLIQTAGLPHFNQVASNTLNGARLEEDRIRNEFSGLRLDNVALALPSNQLFFLFQSIGTGIDTIAFAANFHNNESFRLGIPGVNLQGTSEGLQSSGSPLDFLAGGAASFLQHGLRTAFPILSASKRPQLSQVRALRDFGVDQAGRRAFQNGQEVVFSRNTSLGTIDGFVRLSDDGLSSIVLSARGRNAVGELLPLRHPPVSGGTGLQLLGGHRTLSQNLGRTFGRNQVELGGAGVLNNDLLNTLKNLRFEERSFFSPTFGEDIPFLVLCHSLILG